MRYARLADIRWQVRNVRYPLKTVMLTVHNTVCEALRAVMAKWRLTCRGLMHSTC